MRRGGFWMTTVATGLAVLGLMTVGHAGFRSQAVLFLQGQMKIAAGDTDSGLRLLAEASSQPQVGANATNPLESASEPVKVQTEKPCKNWNATKPNSAPERKVSRSEQVSHEAMPAPEPTLASLVVPNVPTPPMAHVAYGQDAMAYIPQAQREQLRTQQAAFEKAQRIRELELQRAMRRITYKYEANVPSARDIQVKVTRGLQTLAQ